MKLSKHNAVTDSHTVTPGYCLCCWGVIYCADVMHHHFPLEHEFVVLQHNRIEMDYLSQFKCFSSVLLDHLVFLSHWKYRSYVLTLNRKSWIYFMALMEVASLALL